MSNMMVRIWSQGELNLFVYELKLAGYHVTGDKYKKECWFEGNLVFAALQYGPNRYICRINRAYVEEMNAIPVVV